MQTSDKTAKEIFNDVMANPQRVPFGSSQYSEAVQDLHTQAQSNLSTPICGEQPHHIGSALPKYQTDCCKFNLERSTDPNNKRSSQ